MSIVKLVAMAVLAAVPAIARADCVSPATDSERAQCIGHDLRDSDVLINETYGQLRARLSPQGQNDLRGQEIAWIKARAQTCHVDTKEPDRDKWIANLLKDFDKTVCVVRFTNRRIAELQEQQAALSHSASSVPAPLPPLEKSSPTAPALPAPSSATAENTVPAGGDVYGLVAQKHVSRGKWYFEISLDRGEIAKDASAAIFIGVKGIGFSDVGTLQTVHRRDIGQPKVNVGIGVDLDSGKLYIRVNGAWTEEPGSADGSDLKLGRPYLSLLNSSVPLNAYLDHGLVEVNFGQKGFVYTLPDGYQPLDTAPPLRVVE